MKNRAIVRGGCVIFELFFCFVHKILRTHTVENISRHDCVLIIILTKEFKRTTVAVHCIYHFSEENKAKYFYACSMLALQYSN